MAKDTLIRNKTISEIDRSSRDITGVPSGASLISGQDWNILKKKYGSEEILLEELGIVEDVRNIMMES